MVLSCAVSGCNKKFDKNNQELSFHRFPTNLPLRQKWVSALNQKDFVPTPRSFLCSKHFEKHCFKTLNGYTILKYGSVPTVFPTSSRCTKIRKSVIEEPIFTKSKFTFKSIAPRDLRSSSNRTRRNSPSEKPKAKESPIPVKSVIKDSSSPMNSMRNDVDSSFKPIINTVTKKSPTESIVFPSVEKSVNTATPVKKTVTKINPKITEPVIKKSPTESIVFSSVEKFVNTATPVKKTATKINPKITEPVITLFPPNKRSVTTIFPTVVATSTSSISKSKNYKEKLKKHNKVIVIEKTVVEETTTEEPKEEKMSGDTAEGRQLKPQINKYSLEDFSDPKTAMLLYKCAVDTIQKQKKIIRKLRIEKQKLISKYDVLTVHKNVLICD